MLRLDLRQVNENVLGLSHLRGGLAHFTPGVYQLVSVKQFTAAVALVALGVRVVAEVALTEDEAVGQEALALQAELLIDDLLVSVLIVDALGEDVLGDLGLPLGSGAAEVIEVTVEPLIDALVDGEVVIADLFRSLTLLKGLGLSRCTVLVSTAHIQGVVAGEAAIASEHISGEDATDDVTQMGYIVHIGQRRGNENITLVVLGEDLMCTLDAIELGLRGRDSDTLRALLVGLLVTKVATLELIEGEEVELLTVLREEGLHVVVGHDLDRLEVGIVHGMQQAELAIFQTTAILGSGEQAGVQLIVEVLDESLEELLLVVVLL